MEFPNSILLIWNSIHDWKVEYNSKSIDSNLFITKIYLRKIDKHLNVYGKIDHNSVNIAPKVQKIIKNRSLLKSNLQKCIRRGDIDKALVTALCLIRIDLSGFLRRIIIIAIEDVCVTNNIDLLVWLMIAYPNYNITNEIIQYLLLTVYSLANHKRKFVPNTNNDKLDYRSIDYTSNIMNSLLIREEYGGMKGDMALIRKIVNSKDIEVLKVKVKNLKLTRTLSKADILNESIDFHCYPDMLVSISDKTRIDPDSIKKLVWIHNSKYNIREENNDQCNGWSQISTHVREYQNHVKHRLILM